MIIGNEPTVKDRLTKLIERKLTDETGIDCKIFKSSRYQEALAKGKINSIDIHIVHCTSSEEKSVIDYISEITKKYSYSPVIPVIVVGSLGIEINYQLSLLNDFKVIGYRDEDKEDDILTEMKKAVKFVQMLDNRKVTFKRPGYSQVYNERDIYCVMRKPYGEKRVVVTASLHDEITKEEFTIKSSLSEVRRKFSNKNTLLRCHQSWLVNVNMIEKVDGISDMLILSNGIQVPFGRSYLKDLNHVLISLI